MQNNFVNPRPLESYFRKFYKEGKSVKYWSDVFYKNNKNKQKSYGKIKQKILKLTNSNLIEFIDIGGGYGIFNSFEETITQLNYYN